MPEVVFEDLFLKKEYLLDSIKLFTEKVTLVRIVNNCRS